MDRRQFLKGVGLASAAGAAGLSTGTLSRAARREGGSSGAREVGSGSTRYRIDGSSKVYVSTDGGATWATHAKFDERLAIKGIRMDALGRVKLDVYLGGRGFRLALSGGGAWHTA